jgi:predicted RNA-binding Zn-ribbon protein involved in translation (DUF1610 family)
MWECPVCGWKGETPYLIEDDVPTCPKCGALLEVDECQLNMNSVDRR